MKCKELWIFFVIIFFCCDSLVAETIQSVKIVKIIDGDSIVISEGEKTIMVRLWGIDTPEYRQPYSNVAKKVTKKLLLYKIVDLQVKDQDRYGRIVAMVKMKNGEYVNELLVKQGYAWVHVYYCREPICETWNNYQEKAREKKLGLWKDANPVAPWVWKQNNKGN